MADPSDLGHAKNITPMLLITSILSESHCGAWLSRRFPNHFQTTRLDIGLPHIVLGVIYTNYSS